MSKRNISNTFLIILAIVSILGFLTIVLNSFFQIDLGKYTSSILLILFGFAFLVEGQVRFWFKFPRGGFNGTEITHLITGLVGFLAIVVGIIGLFTTGGPVFLATQGIIAGIAIVVIIVETWIVK